MSETRHSVSIHIDNILASVPSSPFKSSIFRVDPFMDNENKNILVPRLVSIGPIHHRKPHLQLMQHHKKRYLKLLLERQKESSVNKYVTVIQSLEEEARKCYADPIDFSPDEFVEMLLFDACFIVELIRTHWFSKLSEMDDPLLKGYMFGQLVIDIMLLENQIPFFVLDRLFNMTKTENDQDIHLSRQIWDIVQSTYPSTELQNTNIIAPFTKNPNHLLDLIYNSWRPTFAKVIKQETSCGDLSMYSATELLEAGIRFKKDTKSYFLDIKFHQGVMKIPTFCVEDATESILRNLVLHELFIENNCCPKYVNDYTYFLQCLINSSKDVELLRLEGILTSLVGDDAMVHEIFKRVGKYAYTSCQFSYYDVFVRVNEHCKHRRNKWMANLRRNYFNTPWAYISFLGAVVLLILTLIQTVFSIFH